MWIVKNTLKATLSFRGLDLSIPAGDQFDLDVLGRKTAEGSNQVQVAFEEGYLENVFKAGGPPDEGVNGANGGVHVAPVQGISPEQFDAFKREFLDELRAQLPGPSEGNLLEQVRATISQDVQQLVSELKQIRERFAVEKGRIQQNPSLSDAEIRARLAFLEEKEQELLKNFESVGREIQHDDDDDGDIMDKADLLANL